jgi:hypothetical protein
LPLIIQPKKLVPAAAACLLHFCANTAEIAAIKGLKFSFCLHSSLLFDANYGCLSLDVKVQIV